MQRIYTHSYVDLDAVAAVWATKKFSPEFRSADIVFRPANWDGSGMDTECDVALDMEAGGKGLKGSLNGNGQRGSAFGCITRQLCTVEQSFALQPLVDFIEADELTGLPINALAPGTSSEAQRTLTHMSLKGVLTALRAVNRDDAFLLARMSEIFDGMLAAGLSRFRAKEEAKQAIWYARGNVALLFGGAEESTQGELFKMGAQVAIYANRDGLGAVRDSRITDFRLDTPEVLAVIEAAGEMGDWFVHPSGFIVARGTRKAPARSKSRVNPRKLAEAVSMIFVSVSAA